VSHDRLGVVVHPRRKWGRNLKSGKKVKGRVRLVKFRLKACNRLG
jgi:hypothetical protein